MEAMQRHVAEARRRPLLWSRSEETLTAPVMHFWAPEIDPAHPLECTQAERYVLKRLSNGAYVSIRPGDQSLEDVADPASAYLFHTHEAALRAAGELNRLGGDGFDVVKVE